MKSKKGNRFKKIISGSRDLARQPDRLPPGDSWRAVEPGKRGQLYGARWRRERLAFLSANPLCVRCLALGIVSASDTVDHVVPHRGDLAIFWNRSRWQALCTPCHSSWKQSEEWNAKNGRR